MMKTFCAMILLAVGMMLAAGCETAQPVRYTSTDPTPAQPAVIRHTPPVAPAQPSVAQAHNPHVIAVPVAWRPRAPKQTWRYIVIHHSATESGNAAIFDKEHRAKGWDELGYHFVIGNGHGSPDGLVEVGPRWNKQKHGAHAKTADNRFNEHGIGICLVGNFQNTEPTRAQQASLTKLVAYLMHEYHISPQNVIGHRDTKPTACPGRNLSVAAVRLGAVHTLAAAGLDIPDGSALTAAEVDELDWDHPEQSHPHEFAAVDKRDPSTDQRH